GVPEIPNWSDNYGTGMTFDLTYSAAGCFSLDEPQVALDDREPEYVVIGGFESYEVHGETESGCVTPSFYLEALPAPKPLSVITLADHSTDVSLAVDRLLVNPQLDIGVLARGEMATVRVLDDRAIARATVWWRGELEDPNRNDWQVEATIADAEIRFMVPTFARGTGTLGVELAIEAHQVDCVGFARCEVVTRGGASFERTIVAL
ncbi:MAG TPA: hypothetical protein VIV11_25140, partial [Kofleriaceae bacterium]